MGSSVMSQYKFIFFHLFVSLSFSSLVYGGTTILSVINTTHFIRDSETIVSKGSTFMLGFFSPNGSNYRYLGIWPNKPSAINVVWVANRDKPLKDSSGVLKIFRGNLVIQNDEDEVVWSSAKAGSGGTNNLTAELLNNGNLVLKESASSSARGVENENVLWESFQHIGDSFVSNMTIGVNSATGKNQFLTSWTSPSDPAPGKFIGILNPLNIPELYVMTNGVPYYRSGPWNGNLFIGIPEMYMQGMKFAKNSDGTQYGTLNIPDDKYRQNFVLKYDGQVQVLGWGDPKPDWTIFWTSYHSECDVYGICGAFGLCNKGNNPICSCLEGFEPKKPDEWRKGNWTSGCTRRNSLHCDEINATGEVLGRADEFLILKSMKVPANPEVASSVESVDKCKTLCIRSCSCIAYAQYNYIGCMYWNRSLIDMQEFNFGGTDLYIRKARKEEKRGVKPAVITAIVIAGTILIGAIIICWLGARRYVAKRKGRNKRREGSKKEENLESLFRELPLLTFEELASATNNFHDDNKLGEGGYGPVYKGTLPGEKEIAVKRRSTASGQGLEQFMNEVLVISKLQHRNLVRLIGCCTENEEKILVYEYMPNGSLNTYIFDPVRKEMLPWRKRFEIIVGIGKGLLYLHRDSRLKIIHRDLKTANVLLDKDFNAKISDFGMAKIFGMDQDQENTGRIVGTFGYMSPEYALEGIFSEKSDVYSFGVLVLEIVSGRKISSFYRDRQTNLALLRHAWNLWNSGEITALIDTAVFNQSFAEEIIKCVHIGLLCAQECAEDRPSMPTVLSMLSSETKDLPEPKHPAFSTHIGRRTSQARVRRRFLKMQSPLLVWKEDDHY